MILNAIALKGALASVVVAASAGMASAAIFTETGDAGELVGAQQNVSSGTTRISGALSGDADLFAFRWGGGALTIDATPSALSDPQLFLFDINGFGVAANDDSNGTFDPELTFASLAAGDYLIGISSYDYDPQSAGGLIFPTFPFGSQYAPTGPGGGQALSGWGGSSFSGGAYNIDFSSAVAAVPLPAGGALLFSGLLGVGAYRLGRRRG